MSGKGYSQVTLSLNSGVALAKSLREGIEDLSEEERIAANDVALNIASNELHATLMYDKSDPDLDPGVNRDSYKAEITGVERLGNPEGRHYALVLLLDSPELQTRFKELQDLGFEHSWPDLKVHLSLNYGDQSELSYPVVKKLFEQGKLPKELTLVNECWNECKD